MTPQYEADGLLRERQERRRRGVAPERRLDPPPQARVNQKESLSRYVTRGRRSIAAKCQYDLPPQAASDRTLQEAVGLALRDLSERSVERMRTAEAVELIATVYDELVTRFSGAGADAHTESVLLRLNVAMTKLGAEPTVPLQWKGSCR